ncbi:MAG TPA: TerB family tellurite resistance protein [Gammaproteobacteria bacterium]|nr:TerB family tellurite resistance protein [Gammaproteobacteria bacterium]HET7587525.1 TerB family tellurite resistance protein [Gammaproteobacteria bacterium]
MFSKLARFLDSALAQNNDTGRREVALRTATAALLIEVARADFDRNGQEIKTVERLLSERFDLTADETRDLMDAARTESDESASLYRFTHTVHEHLDAEEKRHVIEMLWRVALADETLDKYEDSLMHKIADLIYVPHGELMAMKARVIEEQSS